MTVQGFMPIYIYDKRPRIWFPTLCMCCLVYVSLLRQRENWGTQTANKSHSQKMTVFDPHKPLQKDPSENLPRSDLDPKIGDNSVLCLEIRSPMYWECRNRCPRADLHTVLVLTMSQIAAILFCLCDWQLSGLHPLTKEKRARQYGVSLESCRH